MPLSKNTTVGYKGTTQQEQKDIAVLKSRVDKIEKTVAAYYKPKVGQSIPQIALNSRTVELSAIVSFFFIGTLIGASLLDRLWLLGGISMAYWASGAVNRDTRGGLLARRVGVQVVQFIRDWQEKYNQLVIFYQTGQLAYTTSKIWEVYDDRYGIQKKMDKLKCLTMERASDFSDSLSIGTGVPRMAQLEDAWTALQAAPDKVGKLNREFGVTSGIRGFSRNLWSSCSKLVKGVYSQARGRGDGTVNNGRSRGNRGNRGSTGSTGNRGSRGSSWTTSSSSRFSSRSNTQNKRKGQNFLYNFFGNDEAEERHRRNRRGNPINPWSTPFETLPMFIQDKQDRSSRDGRDGR